MTKFLRRPAVTAKTGLGTASIYEKIARGEFPKPVRLGAKAVAWLEQEVEDWQAARIAARDLKAAPVDERCDHAGRVGKR
jgi:prophage regulatory protein